MAIDFYYGSGSPFGWRVWLTLEHKKLDYALKLLSFDAGDLKKPEFLAVSPRGKVPAIVDDGFALHESSAIVEYLEETYPSPSVLPGDVRARAEARRVALEADHYFYPALRTLMRLTLMRAKDDADPAEVAAAREGMSKELARLDAVATRGWLAGEHVSVADFTAFPFARTIVRINERRPHHAVAIPSRVDAWMKRVEALPYYDKTFPPHWKS